MRKQMRQSRATQTKQSSQARIGVHALRRRRRVREAAGILFVLALISLFCVWSRLAVLQAGYRMHDKLDQYEDLQEEYRALRLELATRKSPQNLAPKATDKLGLQQPKPDQVIVLSGSVRFAEQGK